MESSNDCPEGGCACPETSATSSDRLPFLSRAIGLEILTVGWNVVEAGVAITAGYLAGSIALVGFGLDSVIESLSGTILLWRLGWERRALRGGAVVDPEQLEAKEKRALKLVGWTFFVLAAYVAVEAARKLWSGEHPETSKVGFVLLCLSALVMPGLAWAKFRTASALKSKALRGDAKETLLCSLLSVIALAGLAGNAAFGWWWADPAAALALIPWLIKEGREMIRGECC